MQQSMCAMCAWLETGCIKPRHPSRKMVSAVKRDCSHVLGDGNLGDAAPLLIHSLMSPEIILRPGVYCLCLSDESLQWMSV